MSNSRKIIIKDGEEWEQEEIFCIVDLGTQITSDLLQRACISQVDGQNIILDDPKTFQLTNLETEKPMLRLGKNLVFEGRFEKQIGTDVVFRPRGMQLESKDKQTVKVDTMEPITGTSKRIMFKRVKMLGKDESEDEDEDVVVDLETLAIEGDRNKSPTVESDQERIQPTRGKVVRGRAKARGGATVSTGRSKKVVQEEEDQSDSLSSWRSRRSDSAEDDTDSELERGDDEPGITPHSSDDDNDFGGTMGGGSKPRETARQSRRLRPTRNNTQGNNSQKGDSSSEPMDTPGPLLYPVLIPQVELSKKSLKFSILLQKLKSKVMLDFTVLGFVKDVKQMFLEPGYTQDLLSCLFPKAVTKSLPVVTKPVVTNPIVKVEEDALEQVIETRDVNFELPFEKPHLETSVDFDFRDETSPKHNVESETKRPRKKAKIEKVPKKQVKQVVKQVVKEVPSYRSMSPYVVKAVAPLIDSRPVQDYLSPTKVKDSQPHSPSYSTSQGYSQGYNQGYTSQMYEYPGYYPGYYQPPPPPFPYYQYPSSQPISPKRVPPPRPLYRSQP